MPAARTGRVQSGAPASSPPHLVADEGTRDDRGGIVEITEFSAGADSTKSQQNGRAEQAASIAPV